MLLVEPVLDSMIELVSGSSDLAGCNSLYRVLFLVVN